jgi:hypothetical protein
MRHAHAPLDRPTALSVTVGKRVIKASRRANTVLICASNPCAKMMPRPPNTTPQPLNRIRNWGWSAGLVNSEVSVILSASTKRLAKLAGECRSDTRHARHADRYSNTQTHKQQKDFVRQSSERQGGAYNSIWVRGCARSPSVPQNNTVKTHALARSLTRTTWSNSNPTFMVFV